LMERVGASTVPRPAMLGAIRRLRAAGLKVAALTNNWIAEDEGTRVLAPYFDVFVESAVVGLRKPDPRIYQLACERLGVVPAEAGGGGGGEAVSREAGAETGRGGGARGRPPIRGAAGGGGGGGGGGGVGAPRRGWGAAKNRAPASTGSRGVALREVGACPAAK